MPSSIQCGAACRNFLPAHGPYPDGKQSECQDANAPTVGTGDAQAMRAHPIKDEIAQRALMDIATLARAGQSRK
jgi:hypothetical protein